MNEPELFSGMSFEQIQEYADWRLSVPSRTILDTQIKPLYILIANLAARMKELEKESGEK